MFAVGSLLAQVRIPNTTPTVIFTATLATEITRIHMTNTSGNSVTVRVFHNDENGTFTEAQALYWERSIDSNNFFAITSPAAGSGIILTGGGSFAIRASVADAITVSVYGVTETLAERPRS